MARSGERARALESLLRRVGDVSMRPTLRRPGWRELVAGDLDHTVVHIYGKLGGLQEQPRVAPGPWDIQFDDIAVELDEENHFNRYRATTLDANTYERLTHFEPSEYRLWCARDESRCLIYGGYWQRLQRARVRSGWTPGRSVRARLAALEAAGLL